MIDFFKGLWNLYNLYSEVLRPLAQLFPLPPKAGGPALWPPAFRAKQNIRYT